LVAVTVRVEEAPAVTVVGFAVMVTVGANVPFTVTVAVAVALPPAPVAVAVYVVVEAGVTTCVPPEPASVYELLSDPVIVTEVALLAVTVRVEDCPALIVVGFAEMVTVGPAGGFTVTAVVAVTVPVLFWAVAV
jgi:hypothetical protein